MLLDDQKDLLGIMERDLARRPGFDVVSASTIEEAKELISKRPVQLVIADVRLGAHSGFEFAQEIRQARPDIGLILMSAYRSRTNHAQAEELGAFLFLEKPFPMAKLVAAIDDYFAKLAEAQHSPEAELAVEDAMPNSAALSHFQAQDLVQLFCLNGRAIVILVKADEGREGGCIYIQRGNVRHAETSDLSGEEAFYALLGLPHAELAVKDWDRPILQTISRPWEHLLLTAAVRKDGGHIEGEESEGFSAAN
jgi:ActR/RegA family two-component response regulator